MHNKLTADGNFEIGGQNYSVSQILTAVSPLLSERRIQRIDQVINSRTKNLTIVMDQLCDEGNMSAVIRSSEAYGVQKLHSVINKRSTKVTARTTQGCHKWLDHCRYKETENCLNSLKDQGFQIVATHLSDKAKLYTEIDYTKPTAIVVGNEHDGTSDAVLKYADYNCIIPSVGFTQSFNVSVATSIILAEAYNQRVSKFGHNGDLEEQEKQLLKARYYLSSVKFNKAHLKTMRHYLERELA